MGALSVAGLMIPAICVVVGMMLGIGIGILIGMAIFKK